MEITENCPCLGKSLPRLLRAGIMAVLAKEQTHGYQIAQILSDLLMFEGHAPDTAGIYRALKEMQDEGLVISHWQTTESGPAKKLFEITPDGIECLNNWKQTLKDYQTAIDELLYLLNTNK
jgi:PadR family transcriptional regulator, regulatory protein PadR